MLLIAGSQRVKTKPIMVQKIKALKVVNLYEWKWNANYWLKGFDWTKKVTVFLWQGNHESI